MSSNNNGSSDNNRKLDAGSSSSSAAKVTHHDFVGNADLFWEKLYEVLGETKETLSDKIPIMNGGRLDLHQLFNEVTARGGCDKVTLDRKWRQVVLSLNFPPTLTNGSYLMKKYYHMFLYQMEHAYLLPKPDEEMLDSENEEPNPEEGINEPPAVGGIVHVVIDGKYEGGYLVTVKLGSDEYKGLLQHLPGTPSLPQQTTESLQPPPGFPPRPLAPQVPPTHATRQAPSAAPGPSPSAPAAALRGLRQAILAARARPAAPAPSPVGIPAPPGVPVRRPSPAVAASQRRKNSGRQ